MIYTFEDLKPHPLIILEKNNLKRLHIFICPWVYSHLDVSGIYQYHSGGRNRFNQPIHLVCLTKNYTELIMSNL